MTLVTQHNLLSGDKHGDLIGSQVGELLSIVLFLILVSYIRVCVEMVMVMIYGKYASMHACKV